MEEKDYDPYYDHALNVMKQLTDEQRVKIFYNFCLGCGTADLPCHCMNDE